MPILTKSLNINAATSERTKTFLFLFALLSVVTMVMMPSAKAQQTVEHKTTHQELEIKLKGELLNQAELDELLAPIALYPDSLLSQILVASTYPLQVVQATRWRQANATLSDAQVLSAVESKDWNPSVKALAPFEGVLLNISEDLEWLQNLGDVFLQNENQVLASVQGLRQQAHEHGAVVDSGQGGVTIDGSRVIIKPTYRERTYVPSSYRRYGYGYNGYGYNGYGHIYNRTYRSHNSFHLGSSRFPYSGIRKYGTSKSFGLSNRKRSSSFRSSNRGRSISSRSRFGSRKRF